MPERPISPEKKKLSPLIDKNERDAMWNLG